MVDSPLAVVLLAIGATWGNYSKQGRSLVGGRPGALLLKRTFDCVALILNTAEAAGVATVVTEAQRHPGVPQAAR